MSYTYTLDLPSTDPSINKRLGYKLPRSILLPPYLATNPFYINYMDAVDQVFAKTVDEKIEALENLRNPWWTNPTTEAGISSGKIIDFDNWRAPERSTLVKQVNLLGLTLRSAGLLTDDNFRAISRFVGTYWLSKGKYSAVDFINFCLGLNLNLSRLWTQDYITFVKEGDASIGATIYDNPPGPWYPTTHVNLGVPGSIGMLDPSTLGLFFYELANYNLVVRLVLNYFDWNLVTVDDNTKANVVCVGLNEVVTYTFVWDYQTFEYPGTTRTLNDSVVNRDTLN